MKCIKCNYNNDKENYCCNCGSNLKKDNNRLNKSFIVVYVVSCVVAFLTFLWTVQMFIFDNDNFAVVILVGLFYIGLYLIHILISILFFIILLILGMCNIIKYKENKIRTKVILMLSILLIVNILLSVLPFLIG